MLMKKRKYAMKINRVAVFEHGTSSISPLPFNVKLRTMMAHVNTVSVDK